MNRLQFGGVLPAWMVLLLTMIGAVLVWRWYYRETRWCRAPYSYLLPTLRALALALIVLMLAGPSWVHEWVTGELSRIVLLVDASSSMDRSDADPDSTGSAKGAASNRDSTLSTGSESESNGSVSAPPTRLQRVSQWLMGHGSADAKAQQGGTHGWLDAQRRVFRTEVAAFADVREGEGLQRLWDSSSQPLDAPVKLELRAIGNRTALGNAIEEAMVAGQGKERSSSEPALAAIVVLSDGQSNAGESPLLVAERIAQQKVPVYSVVMGRDEEPDDLGVLSVDHNRSLFRTDSLQGTVTIKQQLPEGRPFEVEVVHEGRVVWTESFDSDGQSTRRIDFRIPGEKLLSSNSSTTRQKAVPIELQFRIRHPGNDASSSNDTLPSSLWGVVRKNRVMVVDRRGRWETRYIKNAFQRDSTWELETVLGPEEFREKMFPKSRESFIGLDLLVISIDSASNFGAAQWKWLQDFVAETGGGIIWIDSGREPLPDAIAKLHSEWLPVRFDSDTSPVAIQSLDVKENAIEQRAFAFEEESAANRKLWESLPPPRIVRRVELAPGAELLVAGKTESNREWPIIATRRFGQGRVVYVANDESWRWRYNVADLYHQRFWSQLAQWVMQAPYAVENDYVALDAGDRAYALGQDIPLRARARDSNQSPLTGARTRAIVTRDDGHQEEVSLQEDAGVPGTYSAALRSLAPGQYNVRLQVAGLPEEALQLQTEFIVQPAEDLEMQSLAANRSLLEQIAQITGGQSFPESQRDQLAEALRRYQTGKIEQVQTLLWQSYPWFTLTIALLAMEWILRKRAGLV